MTSAHRRIVVFDLGGVLLRWDPRFLYRKLFDGDEAAMERFLATVCTQEWNERQDAGRSFADAVAELVPVHAQQSELIEAFGKRFGEMVPGAIEETVEVVAELKSRDVPLYALSNWSAETFPPLRARFTFLEWFDGIVISGEEGFMKPDPRIFRVLLERYRIAPDESVFIDDDPRNPAVAASLGMHGIHFRSPQLLRSELRALGLL